MKQITINLADEEHAKLVALAEHFTKQAKGKRTFTVEDCVVEFARTCQPGGSRVSLGWTPPGMG